MQLDLIGKRLGNYQIEQALGRGGMALVYKALDTTLKRPVAIKVIAPDLTDQERYQDRFEHEAQSIAGLDHAHIVPVYYFGKSRALYYLAMKFIEGETLETVIKRYARDGEFLPTADILRLVEAVASALDYAHSKGVIHRDVKPSNIMIDSTGHAYLTDFGLALNVHHGSMGEIFGTAHYIAPEQATSSSSAVPQSDLYSLGVILYELFTGTVPFDDESAMAIALLHITQAPTSPRALNPQLAPAVEQVILKELDKQPEGRYQTGAKLVSALRTALRSTPKPDQKAPALPPLPAGMKIPPQRKVSNRPVANEVQTLLEQRAKQDASTVPPPPAPAAVAAARTPAPMPVAAAPKTPKPQPASPPKRTAEAKKVSARPRRKLRPVLLLLLILAIAGAGYIFTQLQPLPVTLEPIPLPPVLAEGAPGAPTAAPDDWQTIRFSYDGNSFWWTSQAARPLSVTRIRFARPDESATFWGGRWAAIYGRLESDSCDRLRRHDSEESMARPDFCRHTNADIVSNSDEVFWTGDGEFYVYWDDVRVAVCKNDDGTCTAAIPQG